MSRFFTFLSGVLLRVEDIPLRQPDLAATITLVANYFHCDVEELRSSGQNRKISQIRALAAWAVIEFSAATLTEFGHWLSRDVSTLSSAARR